MSALARQLATLPAEVRDSTYSYESFGSWTLVVRFHGVRFRVVYDGRDHELFLERSSARKPPDVWSSCGWRRVLPGGNEFGTSDIAALKEALRAELQSGA